MKKALKFAADWAERPEKEMHKDTEADALQVMESGDWGAGDQKS